MHLEIYRNRPIVYSMGNFISNQPGPAQRSGVIVLLDLVKPAGGKASVTAAGITGSWNQMYLTIKNEPVYAPGGVPREKFFVD